MGPIRNIDWTQPKPAFIVLRKGRGLRIESHGARGRLTAKDDNTSRQALSSLQPWVNIGYFRNPSGRGVGGSSGALSRGRWTEARSFRYGHGRQDRRG